jgi:hypothetical protein
MVPRGDAARHFSLGGSFVIGPLSFDSIANTTRLGE